MAARGNFGRLISARLFPLIFVTLLGGCMALIRVAAPLSLTAIGYGKLDGWQDSDLKPAFDAFRRSCAVLATKTGPLAAAYDAGRAEDWRAPCAAASDVSEAAIRNFFETNFTPYAVKEGASQGLFTGYYEPELKGSLTRHDAYQTPLYAMPPDLVSVDLGQFRDALKGQRLAGRVENGRLVPYASRADIVKSGLAQPAIVYVDDAVDAFFLQIQGSGRITLDDGRVLRAAYAGQNGWPYTAIGAVLVRRGEMTREQVSLQSIRVWLAAHPGEAAALMNENASYVFFSLQPVNDASLGANGSEGVALTPAASLAVDPAIHALGLPMWIETFDGVAPFRHLVIAQDTGGAIRGAVRGDIYWGYGAGAGEIAGRMRGQGTLTVFLPNAVAARIGMHAEYPKAPAP